MPPTPEHGDRQRRLWFVCAGPLFNFWLDENTAEEDYWTVGRVAQQDGFTPQEVRAIYWREVVPAVLGTWGPMDPANPAWLERRIHQRPLLGYGLTLLVRPWWAWVAWGCWREIARGLCC